MWYVGKNRKATVPQVKENVSAICDHIILCQQEQFVKNYIGSDIIRGERLEPSRPREECLMYMSVIFRFLCKNK